MALYNYTLNSMVQIIHVMDICYPTWEPLDTWIYWALEM